MISINEFKSGLTILVEGKVYLVLEFQHVKPGKGAAFIRVKLRDLKANTVIEKTFRGEEKIEEAYIDERKLQYTYHSGTTYHFMDQDNYEEVSFTEETLGNAVHFLQDNLEVTAFFFKGEILNVNLPNFIQVRVVHTEPGVKGDTAKGSLKPAEIETGYTIQVPLFIEINDLIKVDTRTGSYIERVYA
jgi:elongation factor P